MLVKKPCGSMKITSQRNSEMYVSFLLTGILLIRRLSDGYVISADSRYSKWIGNTVPYVIAPGYSESEVNTIQLATVQFQNDLSNCVRFVDVGNGPIPQTMNYVIISKSGGPGTPATTCYSFPGRVLPATNPPTTYGQHLAMVNGPSGCLSSIRQVMRFLAVLLGLRAEHNKPGRDNFVQINVNNMNPDAFQVGTFNTYNPSTVAFNATDFDYNSITIVDPLSYSGNGAPVISSRNGQPIFNAGRLSYRDCQALIY